MVLYTYKLKHLLGRYINLHGDFFDEIKSSHKYFNHKTLIH